MSEAGLILLGGGLLAAGVLASLLAGRVRLPALVVLGLAIGMAAGSDGIGGLALRRLRAGAPVGVVGLGVILFEGGLAAGWPELRPVLGPALGLAVLGTPSPRSVAGLAAAFSST